MYSNLVIDYNIVAINNQYSLIIDYIIIAINIQYSVIIDFNWLWPVNNTNYNQ